MWKPTTHAEYTDALQEIERLWNKEMTSEDKQKLICLTKLTNESEGQMSDWERALYDAVRE